MKIFLDRNKTLLPRVDKINLLARLLVLASICWLTFIDDSFEIEKYLFYVLIGTFTCQFILFYTATNDKFDIKLAYLSMIIYDLFFVPLVILNTGGIHSSYFLLFILTISVAAYVLTFYASLVVVGILSIGYILAISQTFTLDHMLNASLILGFFWVFYFGLVYASEYMHKSESRMLKLLNTLNLRTSELEKYQAHLEMIYENSRVLASILDSDSIIAEVMHLMGKVLHYESYAVIFSDNKGNFLFRARYENKKNSLHLKQIDKEYAELFDKACRQNNPFVIKDVSNRDDYLPMTKNTRSVMIVPMVAHKRVRGLLVAESSTVGYYKERDLQLLSAVSRSAALAFENSELHKKMEAMTVKDELTGAFNYRYFVQKLEEEKRRASRYQLPLSLIMVDIDWFKKLNDTYGHESGNIVLKELSRIIKKSIRDVDIFARYGGEEFAVILPQTPQYDANIIGERIRTNVERHTFMIEKGEKVNLTVSVGLSSYPENGYSQEELVSLADKALYKAKGEGRNLVCIT